MTSVSLVVPGEPCGKARPRFTRMGHAFTPAKTVNAETAIRERFAASYPGFVPMSGPVHMTVLAYFAIPASWSGKRKVEALSGAAYPTKRPDADNIYKLCADGLNALAYGDDAQIVSATVHKAYSDRPRLEIVVIPKEQQED